MIRYILACGFTATLVVGCAPGFETVLYTQDVVEVVQTGEPLGIPALLRVPQASEESCKTDLDKVVAAFSSMIPMQGEGRCVSEAFNNFAELPTMVSLQLEGSGDPTALIALEITGVSEQNRDSVGITIRMNRTIEEMTSALRSQSSEFRYVPAFDPPTFEVRIENDLREPVVVVPMHTFVDGRPHIPRALIKEGALTFDTEGIELLRRDGLALSLSDVAAAHLSQAGAFTPAVIFLPE